MTDNKEETYNEEDIAFAKAILLVDELNQYIIDLYNDVKLPEIGYRMILSTMPSKISDDVFQKILDITHPKKLEHTSFTDDLQRALNGLREVHTEFPDTEEYSLLMLKEQMLKSNHLKLDEMYKDEL